MLPKPSLQGTKFAEARPKPRKSRCYVCEVKCTEKELRCYSSVAGLRVNHAGKNII